MTAAALNLRVRAPESFRVVEGGGQRGRSPNEPTVLRILVVDDDPGDAILTRRSLLAVNPEARVELVSTYADALKAIRSGHYNAALVDYRLGASDGLSLIERCRAAGSRIPLILLTGQGGLDVDLDAIRRGASDYLCKNELTPALLERAIRYALDRHEAASELLASQRRYEAAVLGSHDGIWDWDLRTDQIYLSARFKAMLGFDHDTMPSSRADWFSRVHDNDRANLEAAIADHIGGRSATLAMEYRIQHRDGEWLWVFVRGMAQCDPCGTPERIAGSQSDITSRKLADEQIRHQALHDPLTGLPNRALLFDRLEHAVQRSRREAGYGFSILYLDLDGFKAVNDLQGHTAGDIALVETAARLRDSVRSVDCVARVGGDEFVVLLDRCTREEDARTVAETIEARIRAPLDLPQGSATLGASIGLRIVTEVGVSPADLIGEADRAMYLVKLARRCGDSLRVLPGGRGRRADLEADLRNALARGDIHPHFQPIVDASSGTTIGFEALARWNHAERGDVNPIDFVRAAERAGIAAELGQRMLAQACEWATQRGGEYPVSVNVSPSHVSSPQFAEHVRNALAVSGLPARRLRLELTEHERLSVDDDVVEALEALSNDGVRIDLDDFGTGYSAVELLLRLPVAAIKIDRALIASLDTDAKKLAILRHLVGMAHALDATVTAEGVETDAEWKAAWRQDVDCAQGYLFGRPSATPAATLH